MKGEFDEFLSPAAKPGVVQELNRTYGDAPLLAQRKAPYYVTQQERPAHRAAIELAAKGFDVNEIAAQLGYSVVSVNNWLRQEHSQKTLVNEIRRLHGEDDEVVELIKSSVVDAVRTICSEMRNPKARPADRVSAAEAILNRRYGKPNQPVNRNTDVDLNTLSIAEVAAQLPHTEATGTEGEDR